MTDNPFAMLGWTDAEAEEALTKIEEPTPTNRDDRICICGHAARNHQSQGDGPTAEYLNRLHKDVCKAGQMRCPCQTFIEVLQTNDIRLFTFKTSGQGSDHALAKGISKVIQKGKEWQWTNVALVCAYPDCGLTHNETKLTPVALTDRRIVSSRPEERNAFLCPTHLVLQGGHL